MDIIQVSDISKRYILGGQNSRYRTLRDTLSGVFRLGRKTKEVSYLWALDHITFNVSEGEVLGVIGRNGSGKTTLLKILSRITKPTNGKAKLLGRVGSLLEVGTGFHPELTGRENIFLNSAILGMTRKEIERKFDEIVEFSEIEKFLDTPVKFYSSGMFIRLAFSVAAHLETEILLVDEVLAVGDVKFQRKCLGKMEEVGKGGRTVLFVSHNMAAVSSLCNRSILLDHGKIVTNGETNSVVNEYMNLMGEQVSYDLADRRDRKGSGKLLVNKVALINSANETVTNLKIGDQIKFELSYSCDYLSENPYIMASIPIYSSYGQRITSFENEVSGFLLDNLPANGKLVCTVPKLPLAPGRYYFSFSISLNGEIADWIVNVGFFDIVESDYYGSGKSLGPQDGIIVIDQKWEFENLN